LKPLRIGCVKYLNARPLIRGWEDEVDFDHPSALCSKLAAGELDLALVSSFEFLRNQTYRIIDDIAICSVGPVYSVFVAHRGDPSNIEEVELDPASVTACNLLRCLLGELKLTPRLISASISQITARRGRLLIGDQAIHFRQEHAGQFRFWDLGERWQKLVGLPFVYALWLVRPEVADPEMIAVRLRALRDENLANLDHLIAEVVAPMRGESGQREEFDPQFCARYYREHLRFSFGEREMQGLRTFAKLCEKHGLLSKPDLVFDLV
jgi:predicted solute-binding protein